MHVSSSSRQASSIHLHGLVTFEGASYAGTGFNGVDVPAPESFYVAHLRAPGGEELTIYATADEIDALISHLSALGRALHTLRAIASQDVKRSRRADRYGSLVME